MKEIPRIARDRLAGAGPKSSAAAHPDANLLSAFAERSLAAAERARVFEHLAVCAQCRAEVQLASRAAATPGETEARLPQPVPRASGWRWALRWESLAAVSTAVAAVMMFELAIRSGIRFTAPPAASRSVASAASANAAPILEARNENPSANQPVRPRTTPSRRALAPADKLKQAPRAAKPELQGGAPRGAQGFEAEQTAAGMTAAISPPPAPAGLAKARALALPAEAPAPQASSVTISAGMPSRAQTANQSVPPASGAPGPRVLQGETAPKALAGRPALGLAVGGVAAERAELTAEARPEVRWTVAPPLASQSGNQGDLERSLDGGRTWQRIRVNGSELFRAVFAIGNDVWAGGNGGRLYHSADGGAHWLKVRIGAPSEEPAAGITGIRFSDAEHGRIATSDGRAWITADGGSHWQKLP